MKINRKRKKRNKAVISDFEKRRKAAGRSGRFLAANMTPPMSYVTLWRKITGTDGQSFSKAEKARFDELLKPVGNG